MAKICLHLRAHQPDVLVSWPRDLSLAPTYFDEGATILATADQVERIYRPIFRLVEDLIEQARGAFRFSLGLSGLLLDRFGDHHADVIDLVRRLLTSGAVTLTSETYYHSPVWLYDEDEFQQQLAHHAERCEVLLGVRPKIIIDTVGGAGLGSKFTTQLNQSLSAGALVQSLVGEKSASAVRALMFNLNSLGEAGTRGFEFISDFVGEAQAQKLQFVSPEKLPIDHQAVPSSLRTAEQRDLALALFDLGRHLQDDQVVRETWRRLQTIDHLRDQPELLRSNLDHFTEFVRPARRLLTTIKS